jgi:hypothetical protein
MALVHLQARSGNYRGAVEPAVSAIERWSTATTGGMVLQFVGVVACLLVLVADTDGAIVLAAWRTQHGLELLDSSYTGFFGSAELLAQQERTSPIDLQRLARVAADLDGAAVARFVRERLARLSDETV